MERAEPILILAMPRSGSSMTAGIFAKHGVWTGTCRPGTGRNPKGFFEGVAIKQALMKRYPALVHDGRLGWHDIAFRPLVEQLIAEDGYRGGPWLWKGSAMYWPCWSDFDPTFVVCRRNPEDTFRSARSSPKVFGSKLTDDELRQNIRFHHEQLDYLIGERGAYEVDTRAVAAGNFETIERAIAGCGITFDREVTSKFVDPSLWHYDSQQRTG